MKGRDGPIRRGADLVYYEKSIRDILDLASLIECLHVFQSVVVHHHVNAILICVHIDVEHVNHAVPIDIREVKQIVDLLGHLLPSHETERA